MVKPDLELLALVIQLDSKDEDRCCPQVKERSLGIKRYQFTSIWLLICLQFVRFHLKPSTCQQVFVGNLALLFYSAHAQPSTQ